MSRYQLSQSVWEEGKEYQYVELNSPIRVRDRIEGVKFSKDRYGYQEADAILVYGLSRTGVFSQRAERDASGQLVSLQDAQRLNPETLLDLSYRDLVEITKLSQGLGFSSSAKASSDRPSSTSDEPGTAMRVS